MFEARSSIIGCIGGFILKFLVFLIVFGILVFLMERLLTKLLRIKKQKISDTPGKKIYSWGKVCILILFLCSLPFVVNSENQYAFAGVIMLNIILNFLFDAFMEWKYLKNSKQYVVTLVYIAMLIVLFSNMRYLSDILI